MSKQIFVSKDGYLKLQNELEHLKTVKRAEVAQAIKKARSFGDLSENSEYDDAKNEQAILEARIATIEADLKNAVIIDESEITNEHVHVGSNVRLENLKTGTVASYRIVGSNEANPMEGKISDESPIGKGLLGFKQGDVVEIEIPAGTVSFKILEISK